MSEFKGTPGPWHIANGIQVRSNKHQIAKVWMFGYGTGEANARLIAAAPELLEAVALLVSMAESGMPDLNPHDEFIMETARAAIAKAIGTESDQ